MGPLVETIDSSAIDPRVVGRACADCTMCCKVLSISALQKPQGVWCPHCNIGRGCNIYGSHPSECSTFYCGYLTAEELGEHWRPNRCKLVVVAELEGTRLAIYVDPGSPSAWRTEPYYSEMKQWAAAAVPSMGQVVVMIGRRAIVILPEEDADLGIIAEDDRIVTSEARSPSGGLQLTALKLHKDDPRLTGKVAGVVYRERK